MEITFTKIRKSDDDYSFVQNTTDFIIDIANKFDLNESSLWVNRLPRNYGFGFHMYSRPEITKGKSSIYTLMTEKMNNEVIYEIDNGELYSKLKDIETLKEKLKKEIEKRVKLEKEIKTR